MTICPWCQASLRGEVHLDQHVRREGDLTMCGVCLKVLVIGSNLEPRSLTQYEQNRVDADQAASAFIATMRRLIQRERRKRAAVSN